MKRYLLTFVPCIIMVMLIVSCGKEYLDIKPDKSQVVPQTLQDMQALLDNASVMNVNMPSLQEVSSDDLYVLDERLASVTVLMQKNAYLWASNVYDGSDDVVDWNYRYQQVFYANMVLEGLDKIKVTADNKSQWEAMKGAALFYRSFSFYQLAQLFCKAYDKNTAGVDLGIPLRLVSDINIKSVRGTVEQVYGQIKNDFMLSESLLPTIVSIKTRPNKQAALGMLARTALLMGDHEGALTYAEKAISINGKLINYNDINLAAVYPFPMYNDEVVFHSSMANTAIFLTSRLIVAPDLYTSYLDTDLRKKAFFVINNGNYTFKGSYDGSNIFFNGIATNELYLIRAESLARLNKVETAMECLNLLLKNRYPVNAFVPLSAKSSEEALRVILLERRKELIYRGLRWSDLRRLNKEQDKKLTLTRSYNQTIYTLKPDDPKYVFPIPDIVVFLEGLEQNKR